MTDKELSETGLLVEIDILQDQIKRFRRFMEIYRDQIKPVATNNYEFMDGVLHGAVTLIDQFNKEFSKEETDNEWSAEDMVRRG